MHFLIDLLSVIAVPHIIIQKDGRGGKGRTDAIDGGNRNMKLIIDIPECFYERCKADEDAVEIRLAVKNGTPLDDLRTDLHATAEMHSDGDYYLRDEWIDEYFDDIGSTESGDNK